MKSHRRLSSTSSWPFSQPEQDAKIHDKKTHSRSLSSSAKEMVSQRQPWPNIFIELDYLNSCSEKIKWTVTIRRFVVKLFIRLCYALRIMKPRSVELWGKNRIVVPNHAFVDDNVSCSHKNFTYCGNEVKTTRYTMLTFLPKNLFEQFHRVANLYFLTIAFLNFLPEVDVFTRPLGLFPILFVLSVTAIKDVYEDRRRYFMDKAVNHTECLVFNKTKNDYVKIFWKDVRVGDVLRISCNEIIPADVLLLKSSDSNGVCYMETSSLDGESCLKPRNAVSSYTNEVNEDTAWDSVSRDNNNTVLRFIQDGPSFFPSEFACTVECELPNHHIYSFSGYMIHPNGNREILSNQNFLLRGCELRNTDYIEGLVLYAGRKYLGADTKAMLNCNKPRYKQSQLERRMNSYILWCVVILIALCICVFTGNYFWLSSFKNYDTILFLNMFHTERSRTFFNSFTAFLASIVLFQTMIPISLYVTMELVKLGQIYSISRDSKFSQTSSATKVECRALNIPEELGQIQYILSDKTGTLTENQMIFKRCTINGVDYGNADLPECEETIAMKMTTGVKAVRPNGDLKKIIDDLFQIIQTESDSSCSTSADKQSVVHFFVSMALCNTVVVNALPIGDSIKVVRNNESESDTENLPMVYTPDWTKTPEANIASENSSFNNIPRTASIDSHSNVRIDLAKKVKWHQLLSKKRSTLFYQTGRKSDGGRKIIQLKELKNIPEKLKRSDLHLSLTNIPTANAKCIRRKRSNMESDRHKQSSPSPTWKLDGNFPESSKRPTTPLASSIASFGRQLLLLPKFPKIRFPLVLKRQDAEASSVSCFKNPVYEAESPDELALVYAAAAYGIRLAKRTAKCTFLVMPNGRVEGYDIINVLPFTSERRRMSVIVRRVQSDQLILYCKGADSSILPNLSVQYCQSTRGAHSIIKSKELLEVYASLGMRTLCFAKRIVTWEEYKVWLQKYERAQLAKERKNELFEASANSMERNLELLGVTAVEDRLQSGVPECIQSLREAGINIWVLTGDKTETAINIARACKLFSITQQLFILDAANWIEADKLLNCFLHKLSDLHIENNLEIKKHRNFGLVIHGRTLAGCLQPLLLKKLVRLLSNCSTVLCTRVTPQQKAVVVNLLKKKLHCTTLAIGDGANDVPMLQGADVGIGIAGREGRQAVMASDFVIPRFMMLQRLLLVHGYRCYDRLARMVLYFFYKNSVIVFLLFLYQFFCGYSNQALIDPIYLQLYNAVFTAVPPIVFGILEKSRSGRQLITYPQLYVVGRKNQIFKVRWFFFNLLDSVWQSAVLLLFVHMVASGSDMNTNEISFIVISSLNLCCQIHLLLETHKLNALFLFIFVLNLIVFYITAVVYNLFSLTCCSPDPPFKVAQRMLSQPLYWLVVIISAAVALIPRATFCYIHRILFAWRSIVAQTDNAEIENKKAVNKE